MRPNPTSGTITSLHRLAVPRHPGGDAPVGPIGPVVPDVVWPEAEEPPVVASGPHQQDLLARCLRSAPRRAAVVYPVDPVAVAAATGAAAAGLVEPVLVGPEHTIRQAAGLAGVDLSGCRIVDRASDADSAAAGVELARNGEVDLLAKGSLHTGTLLRAALARDTGIRGGGSRLSHVFVLDLPAYPKRLLLSDAVVAISPTLDDKAAICRNAISVAHTLGNPSPRVAILSAVEDVEGDMPSTLDAAALCKMADRGQIPGAVLDGPLAMDNALSPSSARAKGIVSSVAGYADVLIVPNIEAGNVLYKALVYLAGAEAAGVVVGAEVPIALTSRADGVATRIASFALASIMAGA